MSVRHLVPIALSGALALASWPAEAQQARTTGARAPAAATSQPEDAQKRTGSDWHMIGMITAYSLVAVASGTLGYSMAKLSDVEDDSGYQAYRAGFSSGDVCQHAKNGDAALTGASPSHAASICSEASTLRTVSIVSLVTAIASIGAGTAFFVMWRSADHTAPHQRRYVLTPAIGMHIASAQLRYRF